VDGKIASAVSANEIVVAIQAVFRDGSDSSHHVSNREDAFESLEGVLS
jgi:hypothetical protein